MHVALCAPGYAMLQMTVATDEADAAVDFAWGGGDLLLEGGGASCADMLGTSEVLHALQRVGQAAQARICSSPILSPQHSTFVIQCVAASTLQH